MRLMEKFHYYASFLENKEAIEENSTQQVSRNKKSETTLVFNLPNTDGKNSADRMSR